MEIATAVPVKEALLHVNGEACHRGGIQHLTDDACADLDFQAGYGGGH